MKPTLRLTAGWSCLLALTAFAGACSQKQKTLTPLVLEQKAPPPQIVGLNMTGYKPAAGRSFNNFFVSNYSIKVSQGTLSLVSARDALPDTLKQAHLSDYGFLISGPNSANLFFGDLMLYLAGIVSSQQNLLYCPDSLKQNTSSDALSYLDTRTSPATQTLLGLRDCEKAYLGLDPKSFDFDGDGVPDYLELRCGMNPKNAGDAPLAIAGDGVTNLEKCKRGIPVDESADSQPNKLYAYNYQIVQQPDGTRNFTVTNIPILNGGQDNFLAFHLTETDTTTLKSYLYTGYAILKSGAAGQTYTFGFWATDPTKNFNQEVIFQ